MNEPLLRLRVALGCLALLASASTTAFAFPPAPPHTLYGMVRNQWGDPISVSGAEVFIQTTNGIGVRTTLTASAGPGVNYEMQVPMDSGIALDLYQPTAVRQNQAFQLKVQIGSTTYLPIEMVISAHQIGRPAQSTRLDLTLGEDTDGDGLPDAWEQALIAMLGGTLADITPNGDADGDGISNLNEYLAGTYPFDPQDGFALSIVGWRSGNPILEFLAIRGRTYSLQASANLQQWTPVSFGVLSGSTTGPLRATYYASDVRYLQVEVPAPAGGVAYRYFRALVQ
jgi:hypothetical protein